MKDKNLPDDIKAKSLDELREILNSLLTKIETSPNLENSADDYQKLIKVNNLIEKKFPIQDKKKNQLVHILAASSGHTGIAGGQFLDLSFERQRIGKRKILELSLIHI